MKALTPVLVMAAALGVCTYLVAAKPEGQPPTKPSAETTLQWEYQALTRRAIEEIGTAAGDKPPTLTFDNTSYLTKGLNRLAAEGWEPVLIEPGRTYPITGPGATVTYPPTYIFRKQ